MLKQTIRLVVLVVCWLASFSVLSDPIDTQITFQGSLFESSVAANGNYDLNFQLWDGFEANSGSKLGGVISKSNVAVTDGIFTVFLDFGPGAFIDEARWVEVLVRDSLAGGSYTPLTPFIPIKPSPQSLWAVDAGRLEGKTASEFANATHSHALLSTGNGLIGNTYDGSGARTFTIDFGSTANKVAPGNALFSLNPGNGLTGGVTDDPIGNGVSASIAVLPGPGIVSAPGGVSVKVDTDTIFLNGLNEIQVNAGIAGTGLKNEAGSGLVLGINNGDGISLAGNKVSASVDAETIGFNEAGELIALGAGGAGYGNHTVVALSGGDYPDPVAAMTDRASWCGVPSRTNPCLMKIMPGIYNLNAALPLISYIDIEGSGRNITVLVRNSTGFTGGIIKATGQCGNETCEVRDLSLRADGSGSGISANGIYSSSSAGPRVRNVEIDVSVTGGNTMGIYGDGGNVSLVDCYIKTAGSSSRGIRGDSSTISVRDCIVEANGTSATEALYGSGSNFETSTSEFHALGSTANSDAVFMTDTTLIDNGSEFHGGPGSTAARAIFSQGTGGAYRLDLTQSGVYAANPSSAANIGILAFQVTVNMKDVFLQSVSASGDNTGIEANRSGATIDNSELIANDKVFIGSGTSGGPYVVRISNSLLESIDNATVIQGRVNFSIFAYYSRLAGLTPSFTTCASVVDSNYIHYSNACPP